jgi:hypothetical protein
MPIGTEAQFTAVYRAHHEDVLRFARRWAQPMNVHAIVGETLLAAWRRRRELPPRSPAVAVRHRTQRDNGDFRGEVASMVVHRGDDAFLCLTGSDGTGLSADTAAGESVTDGAPAPASTGLTARTPREPGQATAAPAAVAWPPYDPYRRRSPDRGTGLKRRSRTARLIQRPVLRPVEGASGTPPRRRAGQRRR